MHQIAKKNTARRLGLVPQTVVPEPKVRVVLEFDPTADPAAISAYVSNEITSAMKKFLADLPAAVIACPGRAASRS